jgi:hypothetical protein
MSDPPGFDPVPVWFGIGTVLALFLGTGAGILGRLSGQNLAAAVLTGGVCFATTVTLVVVVIALLCHRR